MHLNTPLKILQYNHVFLLPIRVTVWVKTNHNRTGSEQLKPSQQYRLQNLNLNPSS